MSSEQQITANRENAKKSTGPVTEAGKEAVAGNALRHGLTSAKPVVPHIESPEAWEEHYTGTVSTLAPHGHIEGLLAERIALLTWRLGRVVRYETESITILQERAEEDWKESMRFTSEKTDIARMRQELEKAEAWRETLLHCQTAADEDWIAPDSASDIIGVICDEVHISAYINEECEVPEYPGLGSVLWSQHQWTAGLVRGYAAALVRKGEEQMRLLHLEDDEDYTPREDASIWFKVLESALKQVESSKAEIARYGWHLDHWRRRKMLPGAEILIKVSRYETHLERSLFRTMQELRQLQEQRQVRTTPVRKAEARTSTVPDSPSNGESMDRQ